MFECLEKDRKKHPLREVQDDIKFLYQATMGCGHFVDKNTSYKLILTESNAPCKPYIEPLGEKYVRLYFGKVTPVEAAVISRLFVSSCVENENLDMLYEALITITNTSNEAFIQNYIKQGMPMISHSDTYRNAYHPCYRVVLKEYAVYYDLLIKIESQSLGVIGIDGRCGSGKTHLGEAISHLYECPLIHIDDFFLPHYLRTENRINIHDERFIKEVIEPYTLKQAMHVGKFTHRLMDVGSYETIPYHPMLVVEGSYAFVSSLIDFYDYKIFVDVNPIKQMERIKKRNGSYATVFETKWIPQEEQYFKTYKVDKLADVVFDSSNVY